MRKRFHTSYLEAEPYLTKDGSAIRELMHPSLHGDGRQSLAEATVPPGGETHLHLHRVAEEIYHVTAGEGVMTLGPEEFPLHPGDTVRILPGVEHKLRNTGPIPLTVLCCCSPAYSHEDTELLSRP